MENETEEYELAESPQEVAIEDIPEGTDQDEKVGGLVSHVMSKFTRAETARFVDEQRWLRAYRNYRGLYGPDMIWRDEEQSKIFVKVTKTKVQAAYGQIIEVMFGSGKFPIGVDPTTIPEGVEDAVHFDTQGSPQEGLQPLAPGEVRTNLKLGPLEDKLEPVADKLVRGPGTKPTDITFHPAMVAAKKMEKQIQDQLEESNANKAGCSAAFECALFGTGIMKGPFLTTKEYADWDDEGNYAPVIKDTEPRVDWVSIWDFYPDPDGHNMDELEFGLQRHKLSRSKLRALKKRPHFRENAIDLAINYGENYVEKWWESQMDEEQNNAHVERYEVLEYWGYVDVDDLEEDNVEVPQELRNEEQVHVNIWVCNGQIIRAVMNPFKPAYLPYHAFPYEHNPFSFFGIGVAENMDDTQAMMNGFMRMAIDNGALSGNMIFEINEDALTPGQDFKIHPGKVFRRQSGAPGQAIFGTKFPNVSNENMQMFDKARVLADESTGLPSFAHGQTGVSGVGRTSSGISMLMSAANGSIRTVVKNIDDYLLMPLGKAMFRFNMQFNFDKDIVGDLEIKARGTESLMASEVRSQRLMQFLGVVQNPQLAPFAKMDYIIREIAKSMDLDADKVVNNLGDAAIYAEVMRQLNPQQETMPPQEGAPGVPSPADQQGSGGGNIGTGAATVPGETGFSGPQ